MSVLKPGVNRSCGLALSVLEQTSIYNALSSSVAGAGHSQLKHCHHLDIMENSNNHKQILEQKLCIMLDETNERGNGNWGNELKEKVFEWEAFSSAPQVALKHLWLRGVFNVFQCPWRISESSICLRPERRIIFSLTIASVAHIHCWIYTTS